MSEPGKKIFQAQFLPVQAKVDVKSVKEDDYSVPVHLWYDRLLSDYSVTMLLEVKSGQGLWTALNKFSKFALVILSQSIYSSFFRFLQNQWITGTHLHLDINGPLETYQPSSEEFVKMWKPVYIVCIISLSVPGGVGTMVHGFCSGYGHLSLKLLLEMIFLSSG